MKKLTAIVLSLLLLFSLTACGSETPSTTAAAAETTAAAADKLAAVKAAGKLVAATSPDYPPFENLEGTEVVGIEVEILKLVCKELGVELELAQMEFDAVIPGVQAGKFDIGMSGITATEERKKNMLFTDTYFLAAQAIVVMEGSAISSKADLEGKKISVQTGTTAEEYCMSEGYEVNSYATNSDAEAALLNGKVDAWVIDNTVADAMTKSYNATNPAVKLEVLTETMTSEPYAFALAFGSDTLVAAINEIQAKLIADGTIPKLFEQFETVYVAP